jgi:hypothetical protein
VSDQRLQHAGVPRRADHCVRLDACAVRELDAGLVERLDATQHLDPSLFDGVDDIPVDDRRSLPGPPQPGHHSFVRHRQPVLRQVAEVLLAAEARYGVADPRREPEQCHADHVPWTPPGPVRRRMFGGVRAESQTLLAPPTVRS